MTDDNAKTIPVDPTLAARQPNPATEPVTADQGPPPADYAQRPEAGVQLPDGEGLNSRQVADLLGSDNTDAASVTETNRTLEEAEGVDPND